MSHVTTTIEHDSSQAKIIAIINDEEVGELTLRARTPQAWVANHTHVDPAARGEGVAGQMFDAMVEWARAHDFKIIPTCSYVVKKFEEEGAPTDLLADAR